MMNKLLKLAMLCWFLFFQQGQVHAQTKGSAQEAVQLVKKAKDYLRSNDKEKAFAEFSNAKGAFVDRDLYIFVIDRNGVMVAHGANPKLIGKTVIEMKDVNGKPFGRDMADLVFQANRPGWVDYVFVNPVTKNMEPKSSYLEREGDFAVGCGIFK